MDNQLDVIVTIGGGADGYTPVVGANANWWINGYDTGIKADYASEESLRAQEEALRVPAESARIKAEELRASNELTREREFALMQNAVSDAIASLQQLSTSVEADESNRNRNEELRNQSEADRVSSESGRELNETNRSAKESERIQAETLRNQQEEARKSAETNRVAKETERIQAETLRNQQEEARKAAETKRVTEEAKRVTAEQQRAEKDAGRDAKIKNVEDKNAQLEQNQNLLNRRPQGLKFKAQDNTVFAKTMKALVLGTDDFTVCVVARTEGSNESGTPMFGTPNTVYLNSVINIAGRPERGSNGITWVKFEKPIEGSTQGNSVYFAKTDNTTNLHHIVITRQGTLVTVIINGRLIATKTQDRILDFSNFLYSIYNSSYFWGGAVIKGALTQTVSNKYLWNGGRYDEMRLPKEWFVVGNANEVLLEYLPENIRADRYLNSGTMGSEYDLIYSTVKPEIIYEKPYADKIVLEDKAAPTDFPIAVGQRCYTNNGTIYEANIPAMGSEWAVSNWKQTNNG